MKQDINKNQTNKYTLTSFPICPFVQRAIITLKHKNIDFDVKYIDLKNKPEWFLKLSPLGKVPILEVENTVIFESAVINEFLDEDTPNTLLSKNLIEKAHQRAWIEFGSTLIMDTHKLILSKDEESFNENKEIVFNKLNKIENEIKGEYFSGNKFSLVDTTYAPLLRMISLFEKITNDKEYKKLSKVKTWTNTLLELPEVKESVKETFKEDFYKYVKNQTNYILK